MFALEPVIALPLFFLWGLVMGSFGNVVIGRMPLGESLNGRSHCPHCKKTLGALELIPVISWIFLRAKCRECKKPISAQYPIVELLMGLLFVCALYLAGFLLLPSIALSIVLWSMLLIAVIDYKTQLIPDALTLILAVSAGIFQWMFGEFLIIPALIGIGFFGLQWIVSKGLWVGSGDIFLAGAIGLLLASWQMMVLSLFLAYIIGAAIASILLLMKRVGRKAQLSFGPFLIVGAFVALVCGEKILDLLGSPLF